jgi:hypothetical protein
MNVKRFFMITLVVAMIAATVSYAAIAADSTVVVTPTNQQDFRAFTVGGAVDLFTLGGAVNFVVDSTAPSGFGALQLANDETTAVRAQYYYSTTTPLRDITQLSYYTKQVSGSPAIADPAYFLTTLLEFEVPTTLVFEPYLNPGNNGNATIVPDEFQKYDVYNGLFYSTKTVTCSGGTIIGTDTGTQLYTLTQIKTICPNALVVEFGVRIGTSNPNYKVETDLLNFNGTTYDFEPFIVATSKDQCKMGGFNNVTRTDGSSFKNQGECLRFVTTGK